MCGVCIRRTHKHSDQARVVCAGTNGTGWGRGTGDGAGAVCRHRHGGQDSHSGVESRSIRVCRDGERDNDGVVSTRGVSDSSGVYDTCRGQQWPRRGTVGDVKCLYVTYGKARPGQH